MENQQDAAAGRGENQQRAAAGRGEKQQRAAAGRGEKQQRAAAGMEEKQQRAVAGREENQRGAAAGTEEERQDAAAGKEEKYWGEITDQEIRKWSDTLLYAALAKCGSLEDARDLVQDTLLAFFAYRAGGKTIENTVAFLHTVLGRKYYDMLRKKYQIPVISIDAHDSQDVFADEEDFVRSIISREEGERIRREVAFLTEAYRTIIAKYYFHGRSIQEIAKELCLPRGTVKSRLDFGRKQLKKGYETMENFKENSYMPHHLLIRCSGFCGLKEEPMSLTEDNLLAQNLLILAYDKPVSVSELSRAVGVASAYVEPEINKLVKGELMKRMGDGRVYTDFVIYQAEDFWKYRKEQMAFAEQYAEAYCGAVREAIKELKQTSFYSLRMERYMLVNIGDCGLHRSLNSNLSTLCEFPNRPDGGAWIAFGTIDPYGTEESKKQEYKRLREEYSLCGQRWTALESYLGSGKITLYNYETSLYPCDKYAGCEFATFIETETNLLKLFYLIKKGISPETVDCDPRILKAIPLLEEQGFINVTEGTPKLAVPCLTPSEAEDYWNIVRRTSKDFAEAIQKPMGEYVSKHRVKIPAHLKSVPEQKLTMPYEPEPMMFVFEAIRQGIHPRDLGYVCPETFVIME